MMNNAFEYLNKAELNIKLSKCSFLRKNALYGTLSEWHIHTPTYRQSRNSKEIETPT